MQCFSSYGPPKSVQCDQGTEFKGELKVFLEMIGIEISTSRPRHPQSQGKCERSHGTWKSKIRFDVLDDSRTGEIIIF